MHLELSHEETQLLSEHLARRISHLEEEVAKTEKRTLQHELAVDIDRLKMIHEKILAAR